MLCRPLLFARPRPHNGQTLGRRLVGVRVTNLRAVFAVLFSAGAWHLG